MAKDDLLEEDVTFFEGKQRENEDDDTLTDDLIAGTMGEDEDENSEARKDFMKDTSEDED